VSKNCLGLTWGSSI